jgi:hypothetical protein
MLSYQELLMRQEHSRELLRQAERERLLRQIRPGRRLDARLSSRVLNWLGSRLVVWGRGLQDRYGTAATSL